MGTFGGRKWRTSPKALWCPQLLDAPRQCRCWHPPATWCTSHTLTCTHTHVRTHARVQFHERQMWCSQCNTYLLCIPGIQAWDRKWAVGPTHHTSATTEQSWHQSYIITNILVIKAKWKSVSHKYAWFIVVDEPFLDQELERFAQKLPMVFFRALCFLVAVHMTSRGSVFAQPFPRPTLFLLLWLFNLAHIADLIICRRVLSEPFNINS